MKDTLKVRARFGAFELDLRSGELWEGTRKVVLPEQPFKVLRMLVDRAGGVVPREEIQRKLWPNDTVVEFDHSISAAINKLRRFLSDSADDPKYIETVARRGYRLLAPVEWLESNAGDVPSTAESSHDGSVPVAPQPSSLTGKTVSHYRVLEVIGGGGMGVVYRAEDIKLGRAVALKVLPEDVGQDPRMLERFELEARAASALDHPNICSIYEFGEHAGQPFIVMQLLTGQTLRDRMTAHALHPTKPQAAPFSVDELLNIAIQVSNALEAAHEKGVIHRDVKPANIFLTGKGVVKILDFGLAKLLLPSGEEGEALDPPPTGVVAAPAKAREITRLGVAVGTEGYMSPEQVRSEAVDARTDLFSFGVVMYEMATGQRAFSGKTEAMVREAIARQLPVPVHELNTTLPPELEPIINKALEKDRELRYQSAADMRADLETLKRSREPAPRVPLRLGPFKPRWKAWQLAVAVLVLCAVIAGAWWWFRPARITDAVLADFANSTTDPAFNTALNTALRVELEQTPYLNLLGTDKVRGILKSLSHSESERLTPQLAGEICQRSNSKAVVGGSISDVGNRYRLELKAIDCNSGKTLADTALQTADRDDIVKTLGAAGHEFRRKLGEPADSLKTFNQPLELATSSSLEALQAFGDGLEYKRQRGDVAASPHFRRAVELDPNFAMAYAFLGIGYYNRVQNEAGFENLQKAYDLRSRVTQRQRFYIDGSYAALVTGDLQKAIQTDTESIRIYPDDPVTYYHLSANSISLGRYEAAARAAHESIRLKPTAAAYFDEVSSYLRLDKLDDARQALDNAASLNMGSSLLPIARYRFTFLRGDLGALEEQVAAAKGPSRGGLLTMQSYTESYYGRIRRARELSDQVVSLARQDNSADSASDCLIGNALREAEVGNVERAQQLATQALTLSSNRDTRAGAALAFARTGKGEQAEELAQQLAHDYPRDTMMLNYSLPTIRAAIELQRNSPANAVDILTVTVPYEMGASSFENLYPAYVRGEAYLKMGQGQQAATEFQKLLDHPGIVDNSVNGALAHLQLGRAQVMNGDKQAARKSYEDFLALWKDADPDVPVLKEAKTEYAKLQ